MKNKIISNFDVIEASETGKMSCDKQTQKNLKLESILLNEYDRYKVWFCGLRHRSPISR